MSVFEVLSMSAYPFSVFKRADRPCFLVSFKDADGKYLPPISTRKKSKADAEKIAFQWLRDGIPEKKANVRVQDLSLRDIAKKINMRGETGKLLAELQRMGLMKTFILNDTPQAEDFILFLTTFWTWEESPYIKEKLRKNHGIHKRYCRLNYQSVNLYWKPYFERRFLGEITEADIDGFIDFMGENPISSSRKNAVIKAGTIALHWAFTKGKIDKDLGKGHILYSGENRKRIILTPSSAAALFRANWENSRAKLVNMLAAVTGMKSGEILALRFQDLGSDCLYVNNSWNLVDGLKPPKNNETRIVELPFPDLAQELFEQAQRNPWNVSPESFVFWSEFKANRPMQQDLFIIGLRSALRQIGCADEDAKQYVFHGWRHFYTSYMINRLDKKLLKSQTGHRTDEMLAHYADHRTEGDRELIQRHEREAFAGLLPERQNVLIQNQQKDYQIVYAE
jgi:integrase